MSTVSSGTDNDNVKCVGYNLKVTRCYHIFIVKRVGMFRTEFTGYSEHSPFDILHVWLE